jgi:hypothetical protein
MTDIPFGNIITAIATVLAVVIANRLSLRKTNQERLWDLRRVAYGTILSDLGKVEQICSNIDDTLGYLQGGWLEYWDTESRVKNENAIHDHMKHLRTTISEDYLILSELFIKTFEEFTQQTSADDDGDSSPPEEQDTFSAAVKAYRPKLMKIAKDELQIKTGVW